MPTNNPNTQSSSQPTSKGATEAASSRIEQGGRRAENTIEKFEKTAEQAASSAINRVREAREQATSGLVQQRDQIADRIHKVGVLIRSGSETLADDDPLAHSVLTFVGDTADGIADYVRDATPGAVADDLQQFARRRPGVFFGGAFLLGLAVGRFVKASSAPTGGVREDMSGYGEGDYESDVSTEAYASSQRATGAIAPSASGSSSAAGTSVSGSGTSLPYVSAGNTIGATPSSASYGASSASGTGGGGESTSPSYGSPTVGGTGGYAPQSGSSTASTVKRPSQPSSSSSSSSSSKTSDAPGAAFPKPVREGEGSKS